MDELNWLEKLVVFGGVVLVIYLCALQFGVILKRRRRRKRHEAHKGDTEASRRKP